MRAGGSRIGFLLLTLALSLGAGVAARADNCVADHGGLIDGLVNPVPPAQIQIDGNCTIQNFPASNPMTSNFSFFGNNPAPWLVVFNNVDFVGNMSCDKSQGNAIWFVNGSTTTLKPNCQNLFIPVEKIDKQNPAGQTTASIGVPFTYTLTIPVLFDPLLGIVIDNQGSPNDLHSVLITDDLNATGVDLSLVSYSATWKGTGTPVPLTFSNVGNVLTFNVAPIVPAGQQILLTLTVVLNDSPVNAPGTQFFNTAKWQFGRLINGIFYQPLPGESGISPPLTISAPNLVVTKTGPATLNLGQWGTFNVDVANNGNFAAWDADVLDRLPEGPTGGMCDQIPQILSVTLAGNPLTAGTQYIESFGGPPSCQLQLNLLDAAGPIAPGQHLDVSYRTQLDPDSQNGVMLTNVAGAVQWSDDKSSNASRQTTTRTLTDGTPGVLDFQDAHTVTVALSGYFFEKTVADLTTGVSPAKTAAPGDRLRYTLRLQATTVPLNSLTFHDDLGVLNPAVEFAPGTLALVAASIPPGANTSNTNPNAGTNGAGILDVGNLSVPANSQIQIQFDITVAAIAVDGSSATNQADLLSGATKIAISDDPTVNGQADPNVPGSADPTRVLIHVPPPNPLQKANTQPTAAIGVPFRYRLTVPATPYPDPMYDVRITDDLGASAAKLHFVSVTKISGSQPWTPVNTGTATNLVIEDPTVGIDIPANQQVVIEITVVLDDAPTNVAGLAFTNTANYTFDRSNGDPTSQRPGAPGTTPPMTIVEPDLTFVKGGPATTTIGTPQAFSFDVHNTGGATAVNATLLDRLPHGATGGMCDTAPTAVTAQVFQADGVTPVSGALVAGTDFSVTFVGTPTCEMTLAMLSAAAAIGPDQRLRISYQTQIDATTQNGVPLTNVAGATQWFSADPSATGRRSYSRTLTDGTPGVLDFQDAHTVMVGLPGKTQLQITKQVAVVGGGAALAGGQLDYLVTVTNVAAIPASMVVISDDLAAATPGALTYVAGSATMNGSANGVTVAGSVITADYSTTYGMLAPAQSISLRFRAVISPGLATGTTVTNTGVVKWNNPQETASASVSTDVGGTPGVGMLNGTVWHDANFDKMPDGTEQLLQGWSVDLLRNGSVLRTVLTDAAGTYSFAGVAPNAGSSDRYELHFRAPGAGPTTASLGKADSAYTNGPQRISNIPVGSGSNLQNLNLPITPNGVVYGAVDRAPIAGATLRLLSTNGAVPLPPACFDDPVQQGQVTLPSGFYKFDLNFSDPACPSGGSYLIAIGTPGSGFTTGYSQLIPPTTDAATPPLSVPTCPGTAADAVPATMDFCEATASELAPPPSVPPRTAGTTYYVNLKFDSSRVPGSSQIFNNHLPLDPVLSGGVAITKTTTAKNVNRGQLVPYVITFGDKLDGDLQDVNIVDRFPAGFRYVEHSARLDGVPAEPKVSVRQLVWSGIDVSKSTHRTLQLVLAVGAGVSEGEFVNRAQAVSGLTGMPLSGQAQATVRVVADPTLDCTDVIGKVFDDVNRNGIQDPGEPGLRGVRLVTLGGLAAITDQYGRFHITCAITPRADIGSNFVLKLDDRTLPTGFRMSTRQVQVERATAGKVLRFRFGASIHHVVGLDLSDDVFEPNSTELRPQWKPRIDKLLEQLKKGPSTLRLSYVADVEDQQLVDARLAAMKQEIATAWEGLDGGYALAIEPEVFWRRGGPPKGGSAPSPDGR